MASSGNRHSRPISMLWHIYLRKGQVFVPTVSRTDSGFFMDSNPVSVHAVTDGKAIINAIEAAILRGNPVIQTPSRGSFLVPIILEHAKVKSWATFEKSAVCWKVRSKESAFQLCPMRKSPTGGWEDDPTKIEIHATPKEIAQRVWAIIGQSA